MASTMAAPELRAASDGRGSWDTRLDLVSRVYSASSHLTLRVLIANHQPIVRYGLCDLIESEPDLHLAGEADDGDDAVRMARQLRPDVVLIDLSMPTVDGISATLMIRAELPDTQVIVTSGLDDDISAIEAIRAGAVAYLLKDSPIDELLRTIRGAGGGQVALPMQTAARMVRLMGGHDVLSRREIEVLCLVARGLANKQVARELSITESTVKTHVSGILAKLGLPSRTHVALYAARTGLITLERFGTEATVGKTDLVGQVQTQAAVGASSTRSTAMVTGRSAQGFGATAS